MIEKFRQPMFTQNGDFLVVWIYLNLYGYIVGLAVEFRLTELLFCSNSVFYLPVRVIEQPYNQKPRAKNRSDRLILLHGT